MKNFLVLFLSMCGLLSTNVFAASVNIVPRPVSCSEKQGTFVLTKVVNIQVSDKGAMPVAKFLQSVLQSGSDLSPKVFIGKPVKGNVSLVLDKSFTPKTKGAYRLSVSSERIIVTARESSGLFYGVQSLRQMLPPMIEDGNKALVAPISIAAVEITDAPRFGWRGYMKDVSRTFYSVDVVKKYMDVLALYKMNVMHLHLTDDQGWRIEIKKYPKLTAPLSTEFAKQYKQPKERSGFYTQADIKDLLNYAKDRHITIVPEIDVPGHSWATLLAYPELGVNQNHTPYHVFPFMEAWGHWGNQFTPNSLDPTNEKVYTFLDNVFTEVVGLFPSEYIHFGGDEVMHQFWEREPHVQAFMKSHSMKSVKELQSYFVSRIADIIISKGRKPIGWNDILADSKLTKKTAIMSWLGEDAITKAAKNGYYSVATPSYPFYFDICQSDRNDGTMCDLNYGFINSLKAVYSYEPTTGLTKDEQKYLLGVQANQWPAVPQEVKDINVQNFPRLMAVAEVGWSKQENKDFKDFEQRMKSQYLRLDAMKVDYFHSGGYISGSWLPEDLSTSYKTLEWNMTHKVYASGRVLASFFFTGGKNFMEIERAELLENGKVISSDVHHGLADTYRGIDKKRTFFYSLEVPNYKTDACYTLRAVVRGQGGTDSKGNVNFNLSPYKPFTVIEKKETKVVRPVVQRIASTMPYLQNPTDNGITVIWQSKVPAYAWVEYGTDSTKLQRERLMIDGQTVCNNTIHKIRLKNLEPGKKYYYRTHTQEIKEYQAYKKVFGNDEVSPLYSFMNRSDQNEDFTAIIFNDLHKHTNTLKALFEQVKNSGYDFVVFNGDCIDDPASRSQATAFLSDLNETVGANQVPTFYVRGNHEIRNAYSIGLRSLLDYVNNKTYGAFTWGDTRFVLLDCGEDKPDDHWVYYGLNDFSGLRNEQVSFLKQELASKAFKKAEHRVLIHHIPLYGNETDYNPCRELWEPLLKKANVDVSINAHTHAFAYYPTKTKEGNPYPVIVGGGYSMESATVILLKKRGKNLNIQVIDTKGKVLKEVNL